MASCTLVCVVVSSLASEGSTTTTTKQKNPDQRTGCLAKREGLGELAWSPLAPMFDTFPNTGPSLMHGAVVLKHQNSRQRGVLATLAEARRRGAHPAARNNQESFVNQEDHTILDSVMWSSWPHPFLYRLSVNTGIPSRDPIRSRGRYSPARVCLTGCLDSLPAWLSRLTLSRRCITTSQPHPVIWRADLPVYARFFAL